MLGFGNNKKALQIIEEMNSKEALKALYQDPKCYKLKNAIWDRLDRIGFDYIDADFLYGLIDQDRKSIEIFIRVASFHQLICLIRFKKSKKAQKLAYERIESLYLSNFIHGIDFKDFLIDQLDSDHAFKAFEALKKMTLSLADLTTMQEKAKDQNLIILCRRLRRERELELKALTEPVIDVLDPKQRGQ